MMKRLFIGVKINPHPALTELLSDIRNLLRNESIRWSNPENIHVTLAFLGDTDEKMVRPLGTKLIEKCGNSGTFSFILQGIGLFKSLRDPRVIWAGISGAEKLISLNRLVTSALEELDLLVEERPFSPHLTLGRVKSVKNPQILKDIISKYKETGIQEVNVNEIILFESLLKPSGPVYLPLQRISLQDIR